jgi:hypothetical protein
MLNTVQSIKTVMWFFLECTGSNRYDSTTAVTVAHRTSCTAGSCMESLSPAEGDLRQSYGSSKTALGSAFNQTTHVTMVNALD